MSAWWVLAPTIAAGALLAVLGAIVAAAYVVVGVARLVGRWIER